MNYQIALTLVILGFVTLCETRDQISTLLSNDLYVNQEIDCILDRGPCDAIGKHIKRFLPEVFKNDCRSCTPRQVRTARVLVRFMKEKRPYEWALIVEHYTAHDDDDNDIS